MSSELTKKLTFEVEGRASTATKALEKQMKELYSDIRAVSDHEVVIECKPKNLDEARKSIETITRLLANPSAIKIDTSDLDKAKDKAKKITDAYNEITNGITRKDALHSYIIKDIKERTQEYEKLAKSIKGVKLADFKAQAEQLKSNGSKGSVSDIQHELALEAKLRTRYQELSEQAKNITSSETWKEDEAAINSLCGVLQKMYDIRQRFVADKKNYLNIDKSEFDDLNTLKSTMSDLQNAAQENANKLERDIQAVQNKAKLLFTSVLEVFQSLSNRDMSTLGLGEVKDGLKQVSQEAKATLKEMDSDIEEYFNKLSSRNIGAEDIEKAGQSLIKGMQNKLDFINEQDIKDAELYKDLLKQINETQDVVNENAVMAALVPNGKDIVDIYKNIQTALQGLKKSAENSSKALKNLKADVKDAVASNSSTAPSTPVTRKPVAIPAASSGAGGGNGSGGNGSGGSGSGGSGTGAGNGSGTGSGNGGGNGNGGAVNVPATVTTKVILETGEATTAWNTLKGQIETPVKAVANLTVDDSATTPITNAQNALNSLQGEHPIKVSVVAENMNVLEAVIPEKLEALKKKSNIAIKVDSNQLANLSSKPISIETKFPTKTAIQTEINTILSNVKPNKIPLSFKPPAKGGKDGVLSSVNQIVKEIKEKVGTIPVTLKFDKTASDKVDALAKKFQDISTGAKDVGEAFKSSSSTIASSIDTNLPKLKEMQQVTKDIESSLKAIKGMNLNIKNITYDSKTKDIAGKGINELKKEQAEAEKLSASIAKIIESKEKLVQSYQTNNQVKNGSYANVAESVNKLYETLQKTTDAYLNNAPIETQKALVRELEAQSDALKKNEDEYNKQKDLLSEITLYTKQADWTNIFSGTNPIATSTETTEKVRTEFEAIRRDVELLQKELSDTVKTSDELKESLQRFSDIRTRLKRVLSLNTKAFTQDRLDTLDQAKEYLQKTYGDNKGFKMDVTNSDTKGNHKIKVEYQELDGTLKRLSATYREATGSLNIFSQTEKQAITWSDRFITSLKNKSREFLAYMSTFASFYAIMNTIRQGFTIMKEMDDAMTELKKVSDDSASSIDAFKQRSFDLGNEVGATGTAIAQAAAEWARLGFNMREVESLSKASSIYVNVGDGIDSVTATQDLVSTMKAFHIEAEDTLGIVDKLNEVSNNFAISSSGIGESLKRSSSALQAANNDLDQSIAMITSINEIIQDPEVAGNTLKILSLRIRSASASLKEMGETEDGLVTSTASLQALIQKLTSKNGKGGVNILEPDNKTFRSTYDIMKDISEVWDEMNDTSKSTLLQAIAGKSRANGVAALLSNFERAEEALKTSQEAAGSALAENEKYLDSVSGKLSLLANQWQEMWVNATNSEVSKFFIDLGTNVLGLVNNFGLLGTSLAAIAGTLTAMDKIKLSNIVDFFKKVNISNISTNIDTFFDTRSTADVNSSVIDKLKTGFVGKDLQSIKEYINQQNYLTKAFREQCVACKNANELEGLLRTTRTSEIGITTGLIAKEAALKALRAAAVAGVILAVSATIKLYQKLKQTIDEAQKAAIEESNTESEKYKNLTKAYEQYQSLYNANGKLVATEEQLSEVTDAVTTALGKKAKVLDGLVVGSKTYSDTIKDLIKEEQELAQTRANTAFAKAKEFYDDDVNLGKTFTLPSPLVNFTADLSDDDPLKQSLENLYNNSDHFSISGNDPTQMYDAYMKVSEILAICEERYTELAEKKERILDLDSQEGISIRNQMYDLSQLQNQLSTSIAFMSDYAKTHEEVVQNLFTANYSPKSGKEFRANLEEFSQRSEFKGYEESTKKLVKSIDEFSDYKTDIELVDKAFAQLKDIVGEDIVSIEQLDDAIENGTLTASQLQIITSDGFDLSGIGSSIQSFDELTDKITSTTNAFTEAQVATMSLSSMLSTSGEAIDDVQKKIATIAELFPKAMNPDDLSATETIDLLQEMNNAFGEIGEEFDLSSVHDLDQLDDMLKKLVKDSEWLDKALNGLAISDELKDQIKKAAQEEIEYKAAVQGTVQSMQTLSSAYQTTRGIMEHYNKTGRLTFQNIEQLLALEPQYLALLTEEGGKLKINTEYLQELANQRINAAEQQIVENANIQIAAILEAAKARATNADAVAADSAAAANNSLAVQVGNVTMQLGAAIPALQTYNSLLAGVGAAGLTEAESAQIDAIKKTVETSIKGMEKARSAIKSGAAKAADDVLGYSNKAGGGAAKTAKDTLDKILAELKNAVDDGAITVKEYLDQLKSLTDKYYAQGKISLQEYMDYQRQYYRGVVDMYKEVAAAVQRYFNKQKEPLEDEKEAIQDQINELRDLEEERERAYEKEIKLLEKEKKAVEEQKKAIEDSYNAEIEKIEKKQKKVEEEIKLYEKRKQAIEDSQKKIARQIDELQDQQNVYQQLLKKIDRKKEPIEDKKELYEKRIKEIQRQQKEIEKQKKVYEDQIKLIERQKKDLEKITKELERQKRPLEEQKKYYEKQVKELEKEVKIHDKEIKALQKQQKEINKQKELLEDSKKPYQEQLDILNEQKEALEKQNKAREDAINLQKAQYALEQAHEQRTNLILKNGQFVYEADSNAVHDAEDNLRDAQYQHKVQGIDTQIDFNNDKIKEIDDKIKPLTEANEELQKSIDKIQETIDALNERMESWKERSEAVQESLDGINERISDVKSNMEVLDDHIYDINYNYIQPLEYQNDVLADQITNLNYKIDDLDKKLESFDGQIKAVERSIEKLDRKIDKLNVRNEYFNELLEPIEDKLEKLKRKSDAYSDSIDKLKDKLEQITKKYDKQIEVIDKKIEKIEEERDKFKESIDDQIYALEKQEKAIDKQITAIDRYARQWQRVIDEWQLAKDEKLLEGVFGGNWKERLDALDPTLLEEFAAGFRKSCEDLVKFADKATESIDKLKEALGGGGSGGGGLDSSSIVNEKDRYVGYLQSVQNNMRSGKIPTSTKDLETVNSLLATYTEKSKEATSADKELSDQLKKSSADLKGHIKDSTDLTQSSESTKNAIKSNSVTIKKDLSATSTTIEHLTKEMADGMVVTARTVKTEGNGIENIITGTHGVIQKDTAGMKKSIGSAREFVASETTNINKDALDASTKTAQASLDILKSNASALLDTNTKASALKTLWSEAQGHANAKALTLTNTNRNAQQNTASTTRNITSSVNTAERNVNSASNNIRQKNNQTKSDTDRSMNDVKRDYQSAEREASSKGSAITNHGNTAKKNTNSSMSNIRNDFKTTKNDADSKSSEIIGYAEKARSETQQKTDKIKGYWDELKNKVSQIASTILGHLSNIISKTKETNNAVDNIHSPSGGGGTVHEQIMAKGGRVERIPVAAKGRKIKLSDSISANLNAMAHAVGEDVMIAAKEGEGVFTERQTDDLEELIELTPDLINSTKEYARFANLFKTLTVNPMTVQDNITNNLNNSAKGANGNVVNSQTVKSVSMQIGDVIVQGVENVNDFAAKIKSNLPNAMLQELMATT